MKKTFFTLALLVSTIASAAVKLDVAARYGEDETTQSFELTESSNSFNLEPSCGTRAIISLENEGVETVELNVKLLSRDGETVHSNATIKTAYGEPVSLKCESDKVDAEIVITATQLSVTNQ